MKTTPDPDLELRGKLIRGLGSLREMLPGSFVERKRACGQPNCHCADGKNLHSQFQISVLVDGKPKALNIPAGLAEKVREKMQHGGVQVVDLDFVFDGLVAVLVGRAVDGAAASRRRRPARP